MVAHKQANLTYTDFQKERYTVHDLRAFAQVKIKK